MKRCKMLILLCINILALIINSAYANTRPNTFTLSSGGGEYFFGQKSRQLDNTGIIFGTVGYNLTEHWGIEGLFGVLDTHMNDSINNNESFNEDRIIDGRLFVVDAIYHFFPFSFCQIVEPYILFGVGLLNLNPNVNFEAHDQGNINAGIGLQFFIDPVVSIKVEARDFYTMIPGANDVFVDAALSFDIG